MILTTHALVGAVIGSQISSPWIIIPVSIILHYVMDRLRHGEYLDQNSTIQNTLGKVLLDISVGIMIIFAIIFFKQTDAHRIYLISLGILFSILPDFLTFFYWKIIPIKILEKLYRFHANIHAFPPLSPERKWNMRNARNDIAIILLAIIFLVMAR